MSVLVDETSQVCWTVTLTAGQEAVTVGFRSLGLGVVHCFFAKPKNRNGPTMLEPWDLGT